MAARRTLRVAAALALLTCAGCATRVSRDVAFELDGDASVFLPGIVSSGYSEIRAAVSPDGSTVLWGSTNRPGGAGGWDIWMSRREASNWSAPVAVSFDSAQNDFDPAFAPDGRTVWFFSNRAGGLGGDDIWSVSFDPRSATFGTPLDAGGAINSAGDEWAPTPSPDGRRLLFATNGRGGAGRHDLFTSAWQGGAWQPAHPLAGDVNGAGDDFDAAFVDGGRMLVFARSDDVENAPIALWSAVREGARYVHPQRLDARINVDGGWILGPTDDPAHRGTLLFSGARAGGQGLADIHSIHYRVR
jgi:hypothetical protein